MKFSLPENIYSIISIINNHGYIAHAVGGCVRDILIGRVPDDWDITTNASPSAIKAMFEKTYDTGIKHGTITVNYGGSLAEVTTWRTEARYSDHRRPDRVDFADSLTEDLSRRDFTINALAYHPVEGLIDPFHGINDIKLRKISCVGDPIKRFSEDALRMLRAVRFSSMLDFNIEKRTLNAIEILRHDLAYVSMERIQAEVNKILESEHPEKMVLIWETGLSVVIFPSITILPTKWIYYANKLNQFQNAFPKKKVILLAFLFALAFDDNVTDNARMLLSRLKYDKATSTEVIKQIESILNFSAFSDRNTRKMLSEYGDEISKNTLFFHDKSGNKLDYSPTIDYSPVKSSLSGNKLEEAGICRGREIGEMLKILDLCLFEKPILNDENTLLILAKTIVSAPVWEIKKAPMESV